MTSKTLSLKRREFKIQTSQGVSDLGPHPSRLDPPPVPFRVQWPVLWRVHCARNGWHMFNRREQRPPAWCWRPERGWRRWIWRVSPPWIRYRLATLKGGTGR